MGGHRRRHDYHTHTSNPYNSISRRNLSASPLHGFRDFQPVVSSSLERNPCRAAWNYSTVNFYANRTTEKQKINLLILNGQPPSSKESTQLRLLPTTGNLRNVNFPNFSGTLERRVLMTDNTQQRCLENNNCISQYGSSFRSSLCIDKGRLLNRNHYQTRTSCLEDLKIIQSYLPNTNRITIRHFAKNSKDSGGEGKAGSWRDFNGRMKGFPLSSEFMAALGICVAFTTIVSLPTIVSSMKKSDNQYDELEVEDAIHHQMVAVSKELEPELRKFLNIVLDKGDDNGKRRIIGNTAEIIVDVLNSEALQNAIASLVSRVIATQQFQTACQKLIKALWDDLIHDPETTAQVVQLLNTAIHDENIKRSFKELIIGLLKDKEIYNELTGMVVLLAEENEVLDATRSLLTESAHNALNDPEILDHSMDFAADVVGDDLVQRTSGMALRNTVTYAVSPSLSTFLSIFGGCLVLFSVSAIGNARASAREGREIDIAASVVARNVGTIVLNALTKILTFPRRVVAVSFYAIIGVMAHPLKWIGNTMASIATTTRLHDTIDRTFRTILSPVQLLFHPSVAGIEVISLLRRVGTILQSATGGILGFSARLGKNCANFLWGITNKLKAAHSGPKLVDLRCAILQVIFTLRTFFTGYFG